MSLVGRSILVAGACSLATIMTAPAATSAGAPFDHVVGGGQNNPPSTAPVAHFQINAKSGPNGEDPEGFFSFKRTVDGPPTEEFTATWRRSSVMCKGQRTTLFRQTGITSSASKTWAKARIRKTGSATRYT